MKKNIKEIEHVDLDDLLMRVEQDYTAIESAFLKLYSDIPVFDFELNWLIDWLAHS